MSAFNIFSLPTIYKYVRYVEKLKRDFGDRIHMDFAYVRHPEFLDIKIATEEMIELYLKTTIDFMVARRKKNKRFKPDEILKLERIYNDCIARFKKNTNVGADRFRFVQFINEYDRRRNKNFLEVFPEYKEFYKFMRINV